MALTSFSHLHILSDAKQKLNKPCGYVIERSQETLEYPCASGGKDLAVQIVVNCESDDKVSCSTGKNWFISNKPRVAPGSDATAVVEASSFCKVVPLSTFIKGLTLKLPASVKFMLLQTQMTWE